MAVVEVRKDPAALTLTIIAEFSAPPAAVWQLWADARKLERWWGPPTYPATYIEHSLVVGGMSRYFMTGPTGDRHHGWWRVLSVAPGVSLEVEDGFADEQGRPNDAMPVSRMSVSLAARDGGGTRVTITSTFGSTEHMRKLIDMGMEEGLKQAMGQMDALVGA